MNEYFLYFSKCLRDKDPSEEGKGETIEIQSIPVARERDEMVSFLRNAIFLCPKPMKEKGKLAGGRRRERGRWIHFSLSLYGFVCDRIRGPSSTHRSVISQKRGRNGQVGRYILAYPVVCSVAPYRIFDISFPYPVDTACGKTFDRSGTSI